MRLVAPAKLTLSLQVLGVRADGYHELEALAVAIDEPHDVVTIEPAPSASVRVTGPYASGVPTDASNLALRAALLADAAVAITLHKRIPHAAGLGGGSADAGAVLRALDRPDLAPQLGSDVPFCVRGGAAWMRGRGEVLEHADVPALGVVVAVPPLRCSTPAVYRAWDELGGPRGRTVEIDGLPPLRNDLEPAAERVAPGLAEFRAALETAAGRPALLAGSGSAYAVVCGRDGDGEVAARVADAVDGTVFAGRYLPC